MHGSVKTSDTSGATCVVFSATTSAFLRMYTESFALISESVDEESSDSISGVPAAASAHSATEARYYEPDSMSVLMLLEAIFRYCVLSWGTSYNAR